MSKAKIIKSKKYGCDEKTFNKLISENDILFLIGPRDNGKSYQAKKYVLDNFRKNGNEFIYLRRYRDEAVKSKAQLYFENMDVNIIATNKIFQLVDEDKKIRCGHYMSLDISEKVLKSLSYPKVNTIIFEECLTKNFYLDNETSLLENLISTVYRDREQGKIILIGNLVSPFNPYKDSWSIDTSYEERQANQTRTYIIDGLRVCVWLVPPNNFTSKMLIGKTGRNLEKAVYEVERFNIINDTVDYRILYRFFVEYQELTFICLFIRLNEINEQYGLLVDYFNFNEKTKKCEEAPINERIISNRFSFDIKMTNSLTPLNHKEKIIFDFIRQGNVAYTSNEIGTFFNQAIKNFL